MNKVKLSEIYTRYGMAATASVKYWTEMVDSWFIIEINGEWRWCIHESTTVILIRPVQMNGKKAQHHNVDDGKIGKLLSKLKFISWFGRPEERGGNFTISKFVNLESLVSETNKLTSHEENQNFY